MKQNYNNYNALKIKKKTTLVTSTLVTSTLPARREEVMYILGLKMKKGLMMHLLIFGSHNLLLIGLKL